MLQLCFEINKQNDLQRGPRLADRFFEAKQKTLEFRVQFEENLERYNQDIGKITEEELEAITPLQAYADSYSRRNLTFFQKQKKTKPTTHSLKKGAARFSHVLTIAPRFSTNLVSFRTWNRCERL